MKKYLLIVGFMLAVIVVILPKTTFAAGYSWTSRPSAGARNWYGITSSADGTHLAAFVSMGEIFTSTDSGATWTDRASAGARQWMQITSSADGTHLAAVVNGGDIYTSTDSGATWITRIIPGSWGWTSITSSADGMHLAAVAMLGDIFTSSDGGATWIDRVTGGYWSGIASSSDGTHLVAVSYGGDIYTSTDSGVTWINRTSAGSRHWYRVTSSADGTHLSGAVSDGDIYTSTDSGATWSDGVSAGSSYWYGITSSADGTHLAAASGYGFIYTSTDSGTTWATEADTGGGSWKSVASSSDGLHLAAASNHYIWIGIKTVIAPSVLTGAVGYIGQTGAQINGTVTSIGDASSATPSFAVSGGTLGTLFPSTIVTSPSAFTSTLTGLTCATNYTYTAKATSIVGTTTASTSVTFTTSACTTLPTVTTTPVTGVTPTTAIINGSLISLGGDTSSTPSFSVSGGTLSAVIPVSFSAPGLFTASLSGLTCGTPYTYTAKATNIAGTATAPTLVTFTTSPCPVAILLPGVVTTSVTGVSATTAIVNGSLISLGGDTSSTPSFSVSGGTLSAVTPVSFSAPGLFTASLSGLTCGTNYTYTAKATNIAGTATAPTLVTFTTSSCPVAALSPAIETLAYVPLSTTSVTLQGTLGDFHGATSAVAGFSYGLTTSYGISVNADTPIQPMTVLGMYTKTLTGLDCHATYHFQAIASSVYGASSGIDLPFSPAPCGSIVLPTDGTAGEGSTAVILGTGVVIVDPGSGTIVPSAISQLSDLFDSVFGFDPTTTTVGAKETSAVPSVMFLVNGGSKATITQGDSVTFLWQAKDIVANTCIGTSSPQAKGWTKTAKAPIVEMTQGVSVSYQEIVANVTASGTYTLTGCTGIDGRVLPDQSVTVIATAPVVVPKPATTPSAPATTPDTSGTKLQWKDI